VGNPRLLQTLARQWPSKGWLGWVGYDPAIEGKLASDLYIPIPPQPKMDPNNQDVLIPLIEEVPQVREQKFKFPYYFAGRVLAILTASILAALYLYRFFRLMYLKAVARSMTTRGLDALFRVIIIRMAREGYDVRPPFLTHAEYARIYPQLGAFAAVFTALRFQRFAHVLLRRDGKESNPAKPFVANSGALVVTAQGYVPGVILAIRYALCWPPFR
jgi:hypothetical protein